MDFLFTEEHKALREMVKEFARNEIAPLALKMDEEGDYPKDLIGKMAQLGLMGITMPVEYGGAGMDPLSQVIAMEEISRASASISVVMAVNNGLVCEPIYYYGTEEQKRKYLVKLAKGEMLGCYGLTEPGSGSDALALSTTVKKVSDGYIINGSKTFISNGFHSDIAIIFATFDKALGYKGITAFLVEKGRKGFLVGKKEKKMGLLGSDTAELIFDNCHVPGENLLGKEGEGYRIALTTLDGGRIGIAAQSIGIAQACLDESIKYSKQRIAFGQAISNFQAIQWMIADMATEIEAARWLTYRAAAMRGKGQEYAKEASMAKLYASEMVNRAAYKAIQIHGGYGYIKDYPVERYYRDARVTTLYEGTSEIQRLVIARELLKE